MSGFCKECELLGRCNAGVWANIVREHVAFVNGDRKISGGSNFNKKSLILLADRTEAKLSTCEDGAGRKDLQSAMNLAREFITNLPTERGFE